MYKPWATLNIFMVSFLHLLQGSDYEYGPVKRPSLSALERSEQLIRNAASLEELLRITHSEDWKLWKCRLKLKSLSHLDSRSASHRSTRFAAAFYDIDTLKVIDEEWQKTQCVPRETCVEVAKELGTTTNKFFKPPCVNVFRCGGCCNEESLSCVNTSTTYVSKTLFEISVPLTSVPEPVPVKIANHTGCKCLSNAQHHQYAIIRRSVQYPEEDGCPFTNKLCHSGLIWDSNKCECVVDKEHPGRREAYCQNICLLFQDSLLLLNWLSVDHIWNLMKIIVSVSVDGNVPQIFFKIKRTAAAICAGKARRAALRSTRYFMQKPAGFPFHVDLLDLSIPCLPNLLPHEAITFWL
ncbi:vascular endothelial growth factor D isoform X3 [Emydura macquarii macquarii]|uniref:vascular endothelial growth factor D isoform X3 n=1 Tax=Emydura macquarii macquarii TaxID=1129001 RepID=UPI00352AFCC6